MPRNALTGTRIRERRTLMGLRQADLARSAGVSPSYLNLIEHNRRRIGEPLLETLAKVLGVDPAALAEGSEGALFEGLRDAAAGPGPGAGDTLPEADRIDEFVGRFPGWAALLAARHARVVSLERTVEQLTDRMAHDPFLSASLHEVLSSVTSVRSTAAILAETEDIEPEWRARFHENLHADSVRLAEGAEALVAYLDSAVEQETGLSSPQEEVELWLESMGHHIAPLERAVPPDPATLIAQAPELATSSARKLALAYMERYRADARRLPLEAFRRAVTDLGPDPASLAARFGVDLALVFRRLAGLPAGVLPRPCGLVVCDASGAILLRKPIPGFAPPRFGAACPLWPLYQALGRPMTPIRAMIEVAGRLPRRFVTYSVCQSAQTPGFDGPQVVEASMLILAPEDGPQFSGQPVQPVGTSCRICPRAVCPARREPSILSEGV